MTPFKRKIFDYSFLSIGLLIQVVTYIIAVRAQASTIGWLSLISGCLGI